MKRFFRIILLIALAFGLYVVGVLVYGTLTDYSPPDLIRLEANGKAQSTPADTLTFMTWNIGFSGLGEETDFFYDGGSTVIQTPELVQKNLQGITDFMASQSDVDVFFLQEVDSLARRSHYANHLDTFATALPEAEWAFGVNYRVNFVPVPLYNPMGKVVSGIANYSRLPSKDYERHAYHSQFDWPTRIFFLDRCFLSQRIPLDNGKELVAINTHCSAYDTAGTMVADEIRLLTEFAQGEYEKGNYVVIGGDWNQCPPNYTPKNPDPAAYGEFILRDDQLPAGWRWVADPNTPTNRKLSTPYGPESYTSVIDHFAVSPNLEVLEVQGVNLDFRFSDHQPVKLRVALTPEVSDTVLKSNDSDAP